MDSTDEAQGIHHTTNIVNEFKGGRRYNAINSVKYMLPNDTEESDRLNLQHLMLRYVFQGNYVAPVEEALTKGIRVLDSGCGPGPWTLEMAETYPNSEFHGIDISNVFPTDKPSNAHFQVANVLTGLPFPDNHFDFIHQRLLVAGFKREDWDTALAELIRVLKPGGYLELKEVELSVYKPGPETVKFCTAFTDVMISRGMCPFIATELASIVKNTSLLPVSDKLILIPLNHGGQIGTIHWHDYSGFMKAIRPLLVHAHPDLYGSDASFEKFLADSEQECIENKSSVRWFSVVGQKAAA